MPLRVRIDTFPRYSATAIALREEKIHILLGLRCSHYQIYLLLEFYGSLKEQSHCAGISKYLCKWSYSTKAGLKIINLGENQLRDDNEC